METYIIVVQDAYEGAFRLSESGTLVETVDFTGEDRHPDWTTACDCDPVRGSSPALQEHLAAALKDMRDEG